MRENIERSKEKLDEMAALLGEVLDGKLSQAQAAKKLGITPQAFGKMTDNQSPFAPYIKKNCILTEMDILWMLDDLETPVEALAKDLFGIHNEDRLFIIETETQERFVEVMKETLKPREFAICDAIYGFSRMDKELHVKRRTLRDVGKEFGINAERVRQIQVHALRKLRNTKICRQLLPNFSKYAQGLEELEELKDMNEGLDMRYRAAMEEIKFLNYKKGLCDSFDKYKETFLQQAGMELVDDIPKDWLEALNKENISSVSDLVSADQGTILRLARENELEISVLLKACRKSGFTPMFIEDLQDKPIEEMGLSVRSFNGLYLRGGIRTIGQLACMSRDDIQSIPSIGVGCVNEICGKLEELGIRIAA